MVAGGEVVTSIVIKRVVWVATFFLRIRSYRARIFMFIYLISFVFDIGVESDDVKVGVG